MSAYMFNSIGQRTKCQPPCDVAYLYRSAQNYHKLLFDIHASLDTNLSSSKCHQRSTTIFENDLDNPTETTSFFDLTDQQNTFTDLVAFDTYCNPSLFRENGFWPIEPPIETRYRVHDCIVPKCLLPEGCLRPRNGVPLFRDLGSKCPYVFKAPCWDHVPLCPERKSEELPPIIRKYHKADNIEPRSSLTLTRSSTMQHGTPRRITLDFSTPIREAPLLRGLTKPATSPMKKQYLEPKPQLLVPDSIDEKTGDLKIDEAPTSHKGEQYLEPQPQLMIPDSIDEKTGDLKIDEAPTSHKGEQYLEPKPQLMVPDSIDEKTGDLKIEEAPTSQDSSDSSPFVDCDEFLRSRGFGPRDLPKNKLDDNVYKNETAPKKPFDCDEFLKSRGFGARYISRNTMDGKEYLKDDDIHKRLMDCRDILRSRGFGKQDAWNRHGFDMKYGTSNRCPCSSTAGGCSCMSKDFCPNFCDNLDTITLPCGCRKLKTGEKLLISGCPAKTADRKDGILLERPGSLEQSTEPKPENKDYNKNNSDNKNTTGACLCSGKKQGCGCVTKDYCPRNCQNTLPCGCKKLTTGEKMLLPGCPATAAVKKTGVVLLEDAIDDVGVADTHKGPTEQKSANKLAETRNSVPPRTTSIQKSGQFFEESEQADVYPKKNQNTTMFAMMELDFLSCNTNPDVLSYTPCQMDNTIENETLKKFQYSNKDGGASVLRPNVNPTVVQAMKVLRHDPTIAADSLMESDDAKSKNYVSPAHAATSELIRHHSFSDRSANTVLQNRGTTKYNISSEDKMQQQRNNRNESNFTTSTLGSENIQGVSPVSANYDTDFPEESEAQKRSWSVSTKNSTQYRISHSLNRDRVLEKQETDSLKRKSIEHKQYTQENLNPRQAYRNSTTRNSVRDKRRNSKNGETVPDERVGNNTSKGQDIEKTDSTGSQTIAEPSNSDGIGEARKRKRLSTLGTPINEDNITILPDRKKRSIEEPLKVVNENRQSQSERLSQPLNFKPETRENKTNERRREGRLSSRLDEDNVWFTAPTAQERKLRSIAESKTKDNEDVVFDKPRKEKRASQQYPGRTSQRLNVQTETSKPYHSENKTHERRKGSREARSIDVMNIEDNVWIKAPTSQEKKEPYVVELSMKSNIESTIDELSSEYPVDSRRVSRPQPVRASQRLNILPCCPEDKTPLHENTKKAEDSAPYSNKICSKLPKYTFVPMDPSEFQTPLLLKLPPDIEQICNKYLGPQKCGGRIAEQTEMHLSYIGVNHSNSIDIVVNKKQKDDIKCTNGVVQSKYQVNQNHSPANRHNSVNINQQRSGSESLNYVRENQARMIQGDSEHGSKSQTDINPTQTDTNPTQTDTNPAQADTNPTQADIKPEPKRTSERATEVSNLDRMTAKELNDSVGVPETRSVHKSSYAEYAEVEIEYFPEGVEMENSDKYTLTDFSMRKSNTFSTIESYSDLEIPQPRKIKDLRNFVDLRNESLSTIVHLHKNEAIVVTKNQLLDYYYLKVFTKDIGTSTSPLTKKAEVVMNTYETVREQQPVHNEKHLRSFHSMEILAPKKKIETDTESDKPSSDSQVSPQKEAKVKISPDVHDHRESNLQRTVATTNVTHKDGSDTPSTSIGKISDAFLAKTNDDQKPLKYDPTRLMKSVEQQSHQRNVNDTEGGVHNRKHFHRSKRAKAKSSCCGIKKSKKPTSIAENRRVRKSLALDNRTYDQNVDEEYEEGYAEDGVPPKRKESESNALIFNTRLRSFASISTSNNSSSSSSSEDSLSTIARPGAASDAEAKKYKFVDA